MKPRTDKDDITSSAKKNRSSCWDSILLGTRKRTWTTWLPKWGQSLHTFVSVHTIPGPWPWITNSLEQWSKRVFLFNRVTLPFSWSGEEVWNNSVQHCWTHSSQANHGNAHASRYGTWKSCEYSSENQTAKHILQGCPSYNTLWKTHWRVETPHPHPAPLQTDLWGPRQDWTETGEDTSTWLDGLCRSDCPCDYWTTTKRIYFVSLVTQVGTIQVIIMQGSGNLVSWYFEPSQPQRIISVLKSNFSLYPCYSAHVIKPHILSNLTN